MKKVLKQSAIFLQSTILGGLFFLVPLFVVIIIFGKIWQKMTGVGAKFSALLGIKSVGGIAGGPLMTSIIILGICLVGGFLIKLTFFARFRNWLDNLLVKYIPGYEFYKINLEQKIRKEDVPNARPAVLLTMDGIGQAGVIVDELNDGRKVVFVPSKPGTPEGQVYVVDASSITPLNIEEANLNKLLLKQGKGLKEIIK
jgi:uncharacterized membrane protein